MKIKHKSIRKKVQLAINILAGLWILKTAFWDMEYDFSIYLYIFFAACYLLIFNGLIYFLNWIFELFSYSRTSEIIYYIAMVILFFIPYLVAICIY